MAEIQGALIVIVKQGNDGTLRTRRVIRKGMLPERRSHGIKRVKESLTNCLILELNKAMIHKIIYRAGVDNVYICLSAWSSSLRFQAIYRETSLLFNYKDSFFDMEAPRLCA